MSESAGWGRSPGGCFGALTESILRGKLLISNQVFGPADLCFNAISMLLDIPSNIHEFHEAVDGMFEQVAVFLSQFVCMKRVKWHQNKA
jgi:fungal STAND N-terminal Goodbye domain